MEKLVYNTSRFQQKHVIGAKKKKKDEGWKEIQTNQWLTLVAIYWDRNVLRTSHFDGPDLQKKKS